MRLFYVNGANQNRIFVHDVLPLGHQTVVMLHGWPLDQRIFEYVARALALENYRCVMMDLRGFGSSDAPWEAYNYDTLASDLAAVVNTMRLENFILLGFSMGGAVALRYMTRFQGWQVKKLALVSAAAPSFTRRQDFPYGFTQQQVNHLLDLASQDRPRFNSEFGRMFFSGRASSAMRNWLQNISNDASLIGTLKSGISLRDEDLRDDLNSVHIPCGLFHGRMDKICPFEFSLEMQKCIPQSKLYQFPQAGHSLILEDHVRFSAQLLSFIQND